MRRLASTLAGRSATALLAAAVLAAAGCNPVPPPPGPYAGPKPTIAAQHELEATVGNSLTLKTGPLAGAPWMLEGFSIVENSASPGGRGPVLRVRRGARIEFIPVENDADVADMRFRVLGTGDGIPGKLSAPYKKRLGL